MSVARNEFAEKVVIANSYFWSSKLVDWMEYANLIVRVGGFSERFVNLLPETQQEILSRTLY